MNKVVNHDSAEPDIRRSLAIVRNELPKLSRSAICRRSRSPRYLGAVELVDPGLGNILPNVLVADC